MCVCVCVFSSHSFWTSNSLDVPAGVTQEEGYTGFLIHLPSAVLALIFLARRIQPFLSLVDREVEFCVLTMIYIYYYLKNTLERGYEDWVTVDTRIEVICRRLLLLLLSSH